MPYRLISQMSWEAAHQLQSPVRCPPRPHSVFHLHVQPGSPPTLPPSHLGCVQSLALAGLQERLVGLMS